MLYICLQYDTVQPSLNYRHLIKKKRDVECVCGGYYVARVL